MSPDRLFRDEPTERSIGKLSLHSVFAVAAFVCASATIFVMLNQAGIGRGYIRRLTEKWAHLEAHHDDYDVLFIGSSRVHRHLAPAVFDREMREAGLSIRSYNAGLPSLDVAEALALQEKIEAWRPERLKLIVFEPILRSTEVRNWQSERGMNGQTWSRTQYAMQYAIGRNEPGLKKKARKFKDAITQLGAFACRQASFGRLARAVFPTLPQEPIHDESGFVGFRFGDEEFAHFREEFLPDQEKHTRVMANPPADIWETPPLGESERAFIEESVAAYRAMGIEVVFLLGPSVLGKKRLAAPLQSDLSELEVPTFNYLLTYGGEPMYQPDLWFDRAHLTRDGALLFTEMLADDMTPVMRETFGNEGAAAEERD